MGLLAACGAGVRRAGVGRPKGCGGPWRTWRMGQDVVFEACTSHRMDCFFLFVCFLVLELIKPKVVSNRVTTKNDNQQQNQWMDNLEKGGNHKI